MTLTTGSDRWKWHRIAFAFLWLAWCPQISSILGHMSTPQRLSDISLCLYMLSNSLLYFFCPVFWAHWNAATNCFLGTQYTNDLSPCSRSWSFLFVWLVGFILNCSLRSVTLFPWQLYHQQRSSSPTILSSHAFALGHSDMPDKCFKAQLPALYITGILFGNSGQELLSRLSSLDPRRKGRWGRK